MICPDCGRSDGFCDCLLTAAPRDRGGSPEAGATGAQTPTEAAAGGAFGTSNGQRGRDTPEAKAPAGTDWGGSLLEFLRDFESASPQSNRPVSTDQSGRNRPVGRAPLDLDLGEEGPLAAAGRPAETPNSAAASTHASFSDYSGTNGATPRPVPASSAAVSPLRVAHFATTSQVDDPQTVCPEGP
jgi:hypothetical protein